MNSLKPIFGIMTCTLFFACGTVEAGQIDEACVGKHLMPMSEPTKQSNGEYTFGSYNNPIVATLIKRNQYSVISAIAMDGGKWCLGEINVSGQVDGNSYSSIVGATYR